MRILFAGFHGGEMSPLLEGRSDLAQTATSCRLLRNAIPRALGGALQRPGFLYAGMQRTQDSPARLIPFAFSAAVTYRIELGEHYARFWIGNRLCVHQEGLSGPQYLSGPGQPLTLVTPWSAQEVFRLQYAQANDVTWLTHDSHWPRRLIRHGLEDWRIDEMPVAVPPLRDPNTEAGITLQASAVTGAVTLTAVGSVFGPGDVGGYYEVAHRRDLPFAEFPLTANTTGSALRIVGKWEVFTYGKLTGVLRLERERERAAGVWETIRSWTSRDDFNAQANGEVDGDNQLRLRYEGGGTAISGVNPRAQLSAVDATVRGLVKVTGYTSATVVTGQVVRPIHSTDATYVWSEGAWSTRRGFPRAVTLHDQRLLMAGNASQGQTVWGTAVNGYDTFERTTLADAGFAYQVAAQQANPIVWMASQKGLLIGTEGDEWLMDGGKDSETITAQNVRAERRSGHGSANIQAMLIGSAVVFVQNGGAILNEYLFDFQQQGYEAVDLTELAEHLGDEGIVQMAYAQNPHSLLWAVTAEGSLLSLTYKRRAQVLAWAKHTTIGGRFESVCTTPGSNGIHEVWVTVRRDIDGRVIRTVEHMDPEHWTKVKTSSTRQLCCADGGVARTGAAFTELAGLDHLEGAMVGVLADGAIHPARRVTAGKITLERAATAAVAGVAPLVQIQPMPVEFQMDTGASFGRRFRVPELDLRLWQTGGAPQYANSPESRAYDLPMRSALDATGQPVPLFTGIRKVPNPATHDDATRVIVSNRTMLPLHLLSMVLQVDVNGP